MARSSREIARTLFSVALGQGGYFTAKQAQEAGYGYSHLEYHVASGNFERVDHGLYRMANIPRGEHDELIRWTLWSRNQNDDPQAVASHETALVLYGLTELLPNKLHFTVRPKFRKAAPKGSVLHKASLDPKEMEEREGFRVTTPLRTLLDAISGGLSREQIQKAVDDAITRGLIRRKELDAALKKIGSVLPNNKKAQKVRA